jgi:hypothetical protein
MLLLAFWPGSCSSPEKYRICPVDSRAAWMAMTSELTTVPLLFFTTNHLDMCPPDLGEHPYATGAVDSPHDAPVLTSPKCSRADVFRDERVLLWPTKSR